MRKPADPKRRAPRERGTPQRASNAAEASEGGVSPSAQAGWVALGVVAKGHGLTGELRVHLYNSESDLLWRLREVLLVCRDGTERRATILAVREAPAAVLLTLAHVESREAAEALRGAELRVSRNELDAPAEDEFYVCDLEGCDVFVGGEAIGVIERVLPYPTCETLVVARRDGSRIEVPMHEDFVAAIRIAERVVELRDLEALEALQ
jgi:16S rRNA processing protein RimM